MTQIANKESKTLDIDLIADGKKKLNDQFSQVIANAKQKSLEGLRVVEERICEPYRGHSFELKKGQIIRYELIEGPQIIDTVYRVKSNPLGEYADSYGTSSFSGLVFGEDDSFWSNTPYLRPVATIVRDTVNLDKIKECYGPKAVHSFVYPSGRCNAGLYGRYYEDGYYNNCDLNLTQAFVDLFGEEMASQMETTQAFMHFQPMAYDKFPTNYSLFPSKGIFKKGDYVDVLVHDDMYVAFSPCPLGDQNNFNDEGPEEWVCYPIKVSILEGADGPLETVEIRNSNAPSAIEWLREGRKGMKHGKVGTNGF
ncbi:DUF1989 domain-containing protein [Vibrio barjaei]|uniref:DUF1989 domain-containing protein n=1 Tax=Vibrio barjaei TaxID=1676683 RepID=UPI0022842D1D|nr:DUF1989 domain-containing protein [Vibrio barjaei]MCY9871154.1 DUF1989 domain-containing protein [Vibrio barjaei]